MDGVTFDPEFIDRLNVSAQQIAAGIQGVAMRIAEAVNDALRRIVRELRRRGVLPRYPHRTYRQTRYGRVPSLTPLMRARQRELRQASGRRR